MVMMEEGGGTGTQTYPKGVTSCLGTRRGGVGHGRGHTGSPARKQTQSVQIQPRDQVRLQLERGGAGEIIEINHICNQKTGHMHVLWREFHFGRKCKSLFPHHSLGDEGVDLRSWRRSRSRTTP